MRCFPIIVLTLLCALSICQSQELTCKPCDHGFGKVSVGSTLTFNIHLSNSGTKTFYILSKTKVGSEFRYGSFPLPLKMKPGQSVLLPIIFHPTVTGHVNGVFTLVSSALDKTLSLPVAGTGTTGAQLSVTPTSLNFGNVTVGHSASLPTTLKAVDGDITISSDQLTSSEFSLAGIAPPVTIASGSSVQVTLKFTPGQAGTASAKVGFFTNSAASPSVEALTGTGVAPNSHSVTLNWTDNANGVIGYNVYRGTVHGGPYAVVNTVLDASTNFTDYTVAAGHTYFYVTTAVDSSGIESLYSNESKAVVPSP